MKVNQIKTKTINAASASALDDAVAAWVQSQSEAVLLAVAYVEAGGNYSVLISYTL